MASYIPSTLEEQIKKQKKNELSYRSLFKHAVINDTVKDTSILVPMSAYTSKYRNFLKIGRAHV